MKFFRFLQELAYDAPETGIPDDVKRRYDRTVEKSVNKAWSGVLQVAASGFGKGVLITAAAIAVAMAIGGGYVAIAGDMPVAGTLMEAFSKGLAGGFGEGLKTLFTTGGIAFLGLGGAFGAISDARKHHATLMAQIANERAQEYEKERNIAQKKDLELIKDAALGKTIPAEALSSAPLLPTDPGIVNPVEYRQRALEAARRVQRRGQQDSGRSM